MGYKKRLAFDRLRVLDSKRALGSDLRNYTYNFHH